MSRITLCLLCAVAAAGLVALVASPIGAAGVEGKSYTYTTVEDDPETGCGAFAAGGTFYVDVDGIGYEGKWRQRRFRRRNYFRADVYEAGIHYYTNGAMRRDGSIVGIAKQNIPGGWAVRWTGEDTGCTPVAP